ncbi:MAG: glycerol-3-phosphate 1-O-acyltransferase PlsY [Oscillospiraceae bacterium]|nr:glycerol-3-phosphate 1-O-acyltransferase PlsY [Oscillospiraceae bacterium]
MTLKYTLPWLLAYLCGSVNVAILVTRAFKKKDIRLLGSGNAGATNMTRNFGLQWGIVIFILDAGKSTLAILLGRALYARFGIVGGVALDYLPFIFVIVGHCFPVFFGFRGGKGIATAVGGLLVLNPIVLSLVVAVFIFVAIKTRVVALASIYAAFCTPVAYIIWASVNKRFTVEFLFLVASSGLIIFLHIQKADKNLLRVLKETTIGRVVCGKDLGRRR